MKTLRSVLIDIDGVMCTSDVPIARALDAMALLRRREVGIRFVTNASRRCRAEIVAQLVAMGFAVTLDEVMTGALAARALLQAQGLRPFLLVHPGLLPDFDGLPTDDPNAVVIGDAAEGFMYQALNAAFRVLIEHPGAPLIATGRNRYFRAADGLALDAGPYVAALEYAANVRALVSGKPAPAMFQAALDALGTRADETLMIGDDIESDIGGAAQAGLRTVLVRTGKYRAGDDAHPRFRADAVVDDLHAAIVDVVCPQLGGVPDRGAGTSPGRASRR